MTNLKIDLKNGLLEVEGEQSFVREIYGDYKDVLSLAISRKAEEVNKTIIGVPVETDTKKPEIEKNKKKSKSTSNIANKKTYQIVANLNLKPGDKQSLRDFVSDKKPANALEATTVIVYYLQKIIGINKIGLDHIYTCYKDIGMKVPSLIDNVNDIRRNSGWINTSDRSNITMTVPGDNFVEFDLTNRKSK